MGRARPDMFERTIDLSGRTLWGESQWAGYAMLDALIQLHPPLEASALTSIARQFPMEATMLMLQDAPRNQPLLASVREGPVTHDVWVAASNALARLRAHGFTAALLRELSLVNSVFVLDSGKPARGSPGAGMIGTSSTQVPPGFPPIALYSLTAKPAAGAELVSDGPTPIYLQRTAIDASRPLIWSSDTRCYRYQEDCYPRNCPGCQLERLEYLASLAHISTAEVGRAIHPVLTIQWSTRSQVDAAISQALEEQTAGIHHLVRLLSSVSALEDSELGIRLRIEVRIEDQRGDQSVSLPQYPPVELRFQ